VNELSSINLGATMLLRNWKLASGQTAVGFRRLVQSPSGRIPVRRLAPSHKVIRIVAMKLVLAVLVYLLIGAVLGWGILLMMAGKPWLLVAAFVVYVVAFAKIGCLSH
jgi:hypothetical protein